MTVYRDIPMRQRLYKYTVASRKSLNRRKTESRVREGETKYALADRFLGLPGALGRAVIAQAIALVNLTVPAQI